MGNRKNNKTVVVLLLVIVTILSILCVLFATETIRVDFRKEDINIASQNITETKQENNTYNVDVSKESLKNIIEDQLFIVFNFENPVKIEDIDNQDKLWLALNILENEYILSSNGIHTIIVNFSKSKLEETFNSSVIRDLGIKHEDFDLYSITGDYYNRETDITTISKESYKYCIPHASKIKSYEKNGDKYNISMNYLFPDDSVGFQFYYGSINDIKNKTNSIVKAYDYNGYIDAQQYLDNNYDNIKHKLATYNYTFEIIDNKISLVDFSVN